MSSSAPLKRSPLHQFHLNARAKMADFGGWEMPIEYPQDSGGGVINEHNATRESVALFDVSHLGKAEVAGEGSLEFLNSCLTSDLAKIEDGQAQYTMLCDPVTAGVVDDLIVYRKSQREFLMVPNAANTQEVVDRLSRSAPDGVIVKNCHEDFGVIALQGQKAKQVLEDLGVELELDYMSFTSAEIKGKTVVICRTGYTGEFGFEILPEWSDAPLIWDVLLGSVKGQGGLVAGLGARDTLRTEMGYPLHGHELSLGITPVQAAAGWAIGWNKREFWGKDKLLSEKETGPARILRGLILQERGIPRAGMQVYSSGSQVGETTSGTFSPTLKVGIALALIDPRVKVGDEISVDIRGKRVPAKVVKPPFVPSRVR